MEVMGINDGHTLKGFGTGAVGRISEGEHTRLVGNEIRRLLIEAGHNAINCTVDYANSVEESLSKIMDQANRQDLDWFISIHFNAGGGQGVECYTYEGRQYQDAIDVCANISALGFINRGVKDGKGLYVIRKTKAKSMLIEVCFVDTDDANKYLQVGYKAIAKAIVDALVGVLPVVNNTVEKVEKKVENIVVYQNAVDKRAAEYLSDYLKCPVIDGLNDFDYSDIKNVYCVGGQGPRSFTGYCTKAIIGKDRFDTVIGVLKFIGRL